MSNENNIALAKIYRDSIYSRPHMTDDERRRMIAVAQNIVDMATFDETIPSAADLRGAQSADDLIELLSILTGDSRAEILELCNLRESNNPVPHTFLGHRTDVLRVTTDDPA